MVYRRELYIQARLRRVDSQCQARSLFGGHHGFSSSRTLAGKLVRVAHASEVEQAISCRSVLARR
jgi:hypothetical protein